MATIEDVVKIWDKDPAYKDMPIETIDGKRINQGSMYGSLGKQAVIKLSNDFDFPFEPWGNRTCYVFEFKCDKFTEETTGIDIRFERRVKQHSNTQKFYEFLNEKFNGQKINETAHEMVLSQGRINRNHLVLKIIFDLNATELEICDCMKEFIKKTQKDICEFLIDKQETEKNVDKNEIEFDSLSKDDKEVFYNITNKHKVDENSELYCKCKDIYIITMIIRKKLLVDTEDFESEIAHYTRKSTVDKMLIESSKLRLYDIIRMNDPTEGNTLLTNFGIEDDKFKLEYLPFATSFSLDPDSLIQFRLYGKENDKEATGVSMLFDPLFFNKYQIYRCVYINPIYRGEIKSISGLNSSEDKYKKIVKLFEDLRSEMVNIDKKLLIDLSINIRYFVKNYAYEHEQECRIIKIMDVKKYKDKFIFCDNRLYMKLDTIKGYINKIIFAPCTKGREIFEAKTGIECIQSKHPFQG